MNRTLLQRRIAMAAGREPADLLIRNARVFNVFTGRLQETPVSIGAGVFLGFEECEARSFFDAKGRVLVPGLIDAHIHVESSLATPGRFAELVLPHGTTTVVADPHELTNVLGTLGIQYMLECAAHLPMSLFVSLPSCVPATDFEDAGSVLMAHDLEPFLHNPHVSGLGEMMNFPGVINGVPEVLDKLLLAGSRGKVLDGHSPGLMGRDLSAYLCAGISTDHECATLEEFEAKLIRGCHILIREGSAAKNLLALLPGITAANARRCAFCCDDRHADDIMRDGHIDHIVRLAIRAGLDPVLAVTMATLNAAEACGLRSKGAIAPGYDADCVLVDDLRLFNVQHVFARGVHLVSEGRLHMRVRPDSVSEHVRQVTNPSMHVAPLPPEAFTLRVPSGRARVIGVLPHSIVTEARERTVRVDADGVFSCADNPGLVKLAVIERHKATGRMGLGLMEGYGLSGGAVATTVAHDSHNIVAAGDNDADLTLAVQTLITLGGGIVVCAGGEVLGSLPLPIAGLISDAPPAEVAITLNNLIKIARNTLGVSAEVEPFMALSFMALPVIPELKLTARGLFDVRVFDFVPVDSGAR